MYFVLEFIVQFNEFLKIFIIVYIVRRFLQLHSMFAERTFKKATKYCSTYLHFYFNKDSVVIIFLIFDVILSTTYLILNFVSHNHTSKLYHHEISN